MHVNQSKQGPVAVVPIARAGFLNDHVSRLLFILQLEYFEVEAFLLL